ncbi:MAG: hypothetical protein AB7O55_16510 [Lautropia sp.]
MLPFLYQTGNGAYTLLSGVRYDLSQFPEARDWCAGVGYNPYAWFQRLELTTDVSYYDGGAHVAATISALVDDQRRVNVVAAPFVIDRDRRYPKNATVHEWRAANPDEPWFVQLQIHSDERAETDPARFKLCWHVRMPDMLRLMCHWFQEDPARGSLILNGQNIGDDSAYGKRDYKSVWDSGIGP